MLRLDIGVYRITNTINGNCYVGSSAKSIRKRWKNHLSNLRRDVHRSAHLQNAFNLYGEDVFQFQILCSVDPDLCVLFEQMFMDKLKPEYNLASIAGSNLGYKHSPEARANMSAANKKSMQNPERRAKLSAALFGKKRSLKTRAKISAAVKKQWEDPKQRTKMCETHTGHTHSDETKAKMSVAQKERFKDPEARAKISRALRGRVRSPEHCENIRQSKLFYWKRKRAEA